MTDFETWMMDVGYDRVFRLLIKRRVGDWTPYEWDNKFSDESQYEDTRYTFVKIVETIELPDKEILIGYKQVYEGYTEEEFENEPINYRKLSEIELMYFPTDMEDF